MVDRILEGAVVICYGVSAVLEISECRKAAKSLRLYEIKYVYNSRHILAGISEENVTVNRGNVQTVGNLCRFSLKACEIFLFLFGREDSTASIKKCRSRSDVRLLERLDNKV